MRQIKKNIFNIIFLLLICFSIFFRFYNITWGAPYFFHPDERNIAFSVSGLDVNKDLNPHFFAYGSLPIYTIYFLGIVRNILQNPSSKEIFKVSFEEAIIIGRLISAIFSLLIIFLTYKISREISNQRSAIIATVITSTSVAFLQFSHYATFEMWLSFFSILLFYLLILFLRKGNFFSFLLASIVFGVLISVKISSLVLLPALFLSIFFSFPKSSNLRRKLKSFAKLSLTLLVFPLLIYVLTSPYSLFDFRSFLGSITYETNVATGLLPVFYTGSFFNTIPILFHYQRIFPFLLNLPITILSIPAFFSVLIISLKRGDKNKLLLIIFFLILFLSQAILFAKWSRYIIPSLSFLYIVVSIFLTNLADARKKINSSILFLILFFSFLHFFAFIKTVYLSTDSRLEALNYAKQNIDSGASILSEVYDMGIVPFNNYYKNISLFNFYELENAQKKEELDLVLSKNTYIILPSQRILKSRITNRKEFPAGNKIYKDLFEDRLGYKLIYKTPCDLFCKLVYIGDPVFNVEETINVFDRPTVFIFKKE